MKNRIYRLLIDISFIIVCMFASSIGAHAQSIGDLISPGHLTESHQHLDRIDSCTKCHELGKGISASKCLDCHKHLAKRINQNKGFHRDLGNGNCVECHTDHKGKEFDISGLDKATFNHSDTGFILKGKHANVKDCLKCHKEKTENGNTTYLEVSQNCIRCHEDEHKGQLDKNCQTCHLEDSWKPASEFDHNYSSFLLNGRHREVSCAKCHPNGKYKYVELKVKECLTCHQDPHKNKFGNDCQKCHSTEGWKTKIQFIGFDHSMTRFLLMGKHNSVACEKCHLIEGRLQYKNLRFEECAVCHNDVHLGQFSDRTDRGRCEACHNENGFVPSAFGIAHHQRTKFKLAGSHLAVGCNSCHVKVDSGTPRQRILFDWTATNCNVCHEDPHYRQFDVDGITWCESCHTVEKWKQSTFDHNKQSRFSLTGKHAGVECSKCHLVVTLDGNSKTILYKPLDTKCISCHSEFK